MQLPAISALSFARSNANTNTISIDRIAEMPFQRAEKCRASEHGRSTLIEIKKSGR